jgi:hypothetical protein
MSLNDQVPERGQVLLYQTDDQGLRLECRLVGETLWLTLNQMSELFDRDKSVISKHLLVPMLLRGNAYDGWHLSEV